MNIGILGGGLAGISIAHHLNGKAEIIEKETRLGGLLRTEYVEGYLFDRGGSHILFSKNKSVLNEMLGFMPNPIEHRRRAYIFYKGRYIKYPFENGIYALSPKERFEILLDLISNFKKKQKNPRNLFEFFVMKFGRKMTDMYFKPYNEKLWGIKMEEISLDWIDGRVPNPSMEDILRSLVGMETDGHSHQMIFYYPEYGGFESFVKCIASSLSHIHLNEEVKSIKREDDIFVVKTDREERTYKKVISTLPLPLLGKLLNRDFITLVKNLRYNSVTVVGLGVRGELPKYHWVYVPDEDIEFHRIAFLHNYSPNMAPNGRGTIIAEISHRPDKKISDPAGVVIDGLERMKVQFDVEVEKYWVNDYAYIIYDLNWKRVTRTLRSKVEELGIVTGGRFGSWEYMNMDDVWLNAKRIAKKVNSDEGTSRNTQ